MSAISVYNPAAAENADQIVDELGEDASCFELIEGFHGSKAQDILKHFKNNATGPEGDTEAVFFIIDQKDTAKHGLLMVNANRNGFPDAVRRPLTNKPGNEALSFEGGMMDWFEARGTYPGGESLSHRPCRRFAVYNTALDLDNITEDTLHACSDPSIQAKHPQFNTVIKTLNDGLGSLSWPTGDDNAEFRDIYVGKFAPSSTLDVIKQNHKSYAMEKNLDLETFIFIDQAWEKEGLLFVKLFPNEQEAGGVQSDEFRYPITSVQVGELLPWVWTGLMTWEDAKAEVPADRKEHQRMVDQKMEDFLAKDRLRVAQQAIEKAEQDATEGKETNKEP